MAMKDNGKGGDSRRGRRKSSRRRNREPAQQAQQQSRAAPRAEAPKSKGRKPVNFSLAGDGKFARKRSQADRPKWAPPQPPELVLPSILCAWCSKPIKEFATALSHPATGQPVHFDCAISRLAERENLEKGDTIGYIGGGRFGVIHFSSPQNPKNFTIKKILEWESNEIRSDWRVALCEHFSVT